MLRKTPPSAHENSREKKGGQQKLSFELSEPQSESQIYRLQETGSVAKKKSEMNFRIIKLQVLVVMISLALYLGIFGVKYLIVNSTAKQTEATDCAHPKKQFNGWNFHVSCTDHEQSRSLSQNQPETQATKSNKQGNSENKSNSQRESSHQPPNRQGKSQSPEIPTHKSHS